MKLISSLLLAMTLIPSIGFSQTVDTYAPISEHQKRAAIIYNRITGIKKGVDKSPIPEMALLIEEGKAIEAAALATAESGFYNNTVRLMGQRMSTPDDTYKTAFTDTSAMIIGVTAEDRDARELVSSSSFYTFNLNIPNNLNDDILGSNTHYERASEALLADPSIDIASALVRQPQSISVAGTPQPHPDSAGILSLRAFNEACSFMGTNRRCYDQAFNKFMCLGLEDFTDSSAPDARVAIDVTRAPGGDPMLYQTTCRGCHGNMDAFRGAFSKIEFEKGVILESSVSTSALFDENGVAVKYNRGAADGFPMGYRTTDNSWINQTTTGPMSKLFGWRTPAGEKITSNVNGTGLKSFGTMIGNSEAFSRCMVKQVYTTVCGRHVDVSEANWVNAVSSEFEVKGRKLKWLFERVVSDQACIGK